MFVFSQPIEMNTVVPVYSFCPWIGPSFTNTVPGTDPLPASRFPSYLTTKLTSAPDMLSGGAVELIFIAWFVSDPAVPMSFQSSPSGTTTTAATSTISGSLSCDGTELKLADDPQIQLKYTRVWNGPPTIANCILSVTFTSTGGGTELDTFNAWVTSIILEGYTRRMLLTTA